MRHRALRAYPSPQVYVAHKAEPFKRRRKRRPWYFIRLTLAQMAAGGVVVPLVWSRNWPGAIGFALLVLVIGLLKTAWNRPARSDEVQRWNRDHPDPMFRREGG